jgi:hypothetical protein
LKENIKLSQSLEPDPRVGFTWACFGGERGLRFNKVAEFIAN